MPIAQNPGNVGEAVDLSAGINIIPNYWGVFPALGLFNHQYGTTRTVMIPRVSESENILTDRNWNERNNTITGGQRDYITLPVPHYPVDDAITATDINGVVNWDSIVGAGGGGVGLETVESKRAEKMARLRRAHAFTLETARMQVIKDGTVYAPNGTVSINYYTEHGFGRANQNVEMTSVTEDPAVGIQAAVGTLQDNLKTGDIVNNFVALCSPDFFEALINNGFVKESYLYYRRNSQQEGLLSGNLPGAPLDARFSTFEYAGVTFIQVRGTVGGNPYVVADKAYMFPVGTDNFETWFAPAERLDTVNKTALESYYFEYLDRRNSKIDIMTETNFLNVLKRPEQVITLTAV